MYTLTPRHTRGSRTSGVLELYLNTARLNGEEFSHHGERHIEYTVYVQTKKNLSTLIQLYCRIKNNDQNCKPSLYGKKTKQTNKPKNKIHINTNTKYFLAQYKAVPWNAFQHLDWLRQQRAIPQIELHNMSQYLRGRPLCVRRQLATVTEYIMHILIRQQQQQSSDMFLTQTNNNGGVLGFFLFLSFFFLPTSFITWIWQLDVVHAHLRKNVKTALYSRRSRYLKIYGPPVNQNFQYFQKSKFSDIKYCIFSQKMIVYIPSFSTK